MIIEIDNPILIPKIVELAKRLLPNTVNEKLEKLLLESMSSKDGKILVSKSNGSLNGYLLATIESFDGKDVVFIQSSSITASKENRYIGFELITRLRMWAAEKRIEYIYAMTSRNPKSFNKRYNFEFVTNVIRRKVKDE